MAGGERLLPLRDVVLTPDEAAKWMEMLSRDRSTLAAADALRQGLGSPMDAAAKAVAGPPYHLPGLSNLKSSS